jgi:hypothetical protein
MGDVGVPVTSIVGGGKMLLCKVVRLNTGRGQSDYCTNGG